MPAYMIANVDVLDPTPYERYKQMAPPSIAAYGGKYVARGGKVQVLEGKWQPSRLVSLEFPTAAQARAWWESKEYAEAKELRQSCARADLVIIEGL
jgi:uncharacterized protein (DUF1330 family)